MSDIFIHIDFLTLYNFCYIMNKYMLQQTKDISLQYYSNIQNPCISVIFYSECS
jgi:hypothetical protein